MLRLRALHSCCVAPADTHPSITGLVTIPQHTSTAAADGCSCWLPVMQSGTDCCGFRPHPPADQLLGVRQLRLLARLGRAAVQQHRQQLLQRGRHVLLVQGVQRQHHVPVHRQHKGLLQQCGHQRLRADALQRGGAGQETQQRPGPEVLQALHEAVAHSIHNIHSTPGSAFMLCLFHPTKGTCPAQGTPCRTVDACAGQA
jgi:hypothetical protein